jgi:hypothetical protein
MYRVRFHLGAGEHYRMWQVRHPDGSKTYHRPESTCILMNDCYLRNSRRVAERIHAGARKSVCAWVLCRRISITENCEMGPQTYDNLPTEVRFNPRVMPHWHDANGTDLDGTRWCGIVSMDRQLVGAFASPR